jgi:uncharacterized protein YjbI with pentapeptide repeats
MTPPPDPSNAAGAGPSDRSDERLPEVMQPTAGQSPGADLDTERGQDSNNGDRSSLANQISSTPEHAAPEDDTDGREVIYLASSPPAPPLPPATALTLVAVAVILVGLILDSLWLTLAGSLVAVVISLRLMWPFIEEVFRELSPPQRSLLVALPSAAFGLYGLLRVSGLNQAILTWGRSLRWDVIGALGDFFGAFGQILIAMLAVYVAWRQYVISRDLTVQQNRITQQQTIDAYFQGISELVLDDEGLLEDWPQERIIAEARTAAILSSVDALGKAKVIRFLSRSKLLSPLRRDGRLGRPILDGQGGYEESRAEGTRVIDLGAVLAGTDLAGTDLRWTDLSEANLVRADLSRCDMIRANLARTILYQADLSGADLMGARLFYGDIETASPRTRGDRPDYTSGSHTGAVVEGANFSNVQRLTDNQRRYICAWGGTKTRATVPGGCEDVPNLLGR